MRIQIQNLRKSFGRAVAVDGISLDFPSGELVALLGPSGSGKTTLLRLIAGIETPDQGRVLFDGSDVTHMPVRERQIGLVFQHYALFDHMTVGENVAFGLRVRGRPRAAVEARVRELLARMQLEGLDARLPSQLSGGQRQRVALARALAPEPRVLLLDEPFGALDARVRQDLRGWLRRLHDDLHITGVLVTHDQDEAFEVAGRVAIMNAGRLEQVGPPDDVVDQPASAFVMDFIGNVNVLNGRRRGGRAESGKLSLPYEGDAPEGGGLAAYVRSQDVVLRREPNGVPHVLGEVVHARRIGLVVRVSVRRADDRELLVAELPHDEWRELGLDRGDEVVASIRRARIFSADTRQQEPS